MDVNSIAWILLHLLDPSNYSFSRSSSPPPEDKREIPCYISPYQKTLYEREHGVILNSPVPASVLKEIQQLEAKAKAM